MNDPETVKEISRLARQKGNDRVKQFVFESKINKF